MVMVGDLVIWWFGDYGYFVVRLNCRAAYALRIVRSARRTSAKSACKYGSQNWSKSEVESIFLSFWDVKKNDL